MPAGKLHFSSGGKLHEFIPGGGLSLEGDLLVFPGGKLALTKAGGLAVKLVNKTGAASVRGTIVDATSTLDDAFKVTDADELQPIGAVYEVDVADGSWCWIVVAGRCQVLLEGGTASTHGNWVYTSDVAGYADATLAAPPGGGIPELETHMQEIGHCLESLPALGGEAMIPQLCWIMMHFN